MSEDSWKMTSCIRTSVAKNSVKNKGSHKTNPQLSDIFKTDKIQQKTELRNTNILENRLHSKDGWMERIKHVMDLTCRTEDEVIMAIHDCDEDLNRAVNELLEGVSSEWEVKKKKARQSSVSKTVSEKVYTSEDKPRLYNDRLTTSKGRISHINRKWRRRENKENEKNTDDSQQWSQSKNKKIEGILGRGGKVAVPRTFVKKEGSSIISSASTFSRPIETWIGSNEPQIRCVESKKDCWNTSDSTEDWENEEYTGSLADTKVFTPSLNSCEDVLSIEKIKMNKSESNESIKFSDLISQNIHKHGKHRRRVPPPSKIPSSAVEMPGDSLNSSISFLDVQFGALEFSNEPKLNDGLQQEKYISSESFNDTSILESSANNKPIVTSICSLNSDVSQDLTNLKYKKMQCDHSTINTNNNRNALNEITVDAQIGFKCSSLKPHNLELPKVEIESRTTFATSSYDSSPSFQASKPIYTPSKTPCSYNSYTGNTQQPPTTFCKTSHCTSDSFPTIVTMSQGYKSAYSQSNMATFDSSPTVTTAGKFSQTSTSQCYTSNSGSKTTAPQFSSPSSSTNVCYASSPYINSEYQVSTTFNSAAPAYQLTNTSYSTISQGPQVYSNTSQSVYSNYGTKNQGISQNQKIITNKNVPFENLSTSLVTTTGSTLDLTSSSNPPQSKPTISNGVTKNSSNLATGNNSSNVSGSGNGNIAPILGHQYIMGQSVPYATFQQPHMYSYEDLQIMQQRIPHMTNTGYYDAAIGYQSTGPGNSRNDALSSVQGVQNVPTVQAQFNSLSDTRFSRADNNTSPVSSSISQQTSTQHSQPLINPIPPGYAYFYGGSIMPASGFQYGTATMYPSIAPANNTSSNNVSYAKPANYGAGYNSGVNYDTLTNSGTASEYKSTVTGYTNNQTAKNTSSGVNSSTGSNSDVNNVAHAKGHVSINKINAYEKQSFHSSTTPPFGLTNNQNANVISGYGAAHLFIPTVPHQLHQQLHADSGNSTGQRTSSNSQNKSQIKSGYSGSYWSGSN